MRHLAGALIFTIAFGCGGETADPASDPVDPGSRPNVLLVVLDTMRADALGCYGNPEAKTPTLDAFAETGVLFETARSSAPKTLPAHASLFASVFPDQHGAVTGNNRLGDEFDTLPEQMLEAGYRTAAFTDGGYLQPVFGLLQGFRVFGAAKDNASGGIPVVADQAKKWLAHGVQQNAKKPFFLFLQTYQVHSPYAPTKRFRKEIVRPYDGTLPEVVTTEILAERLAGEGLTEADQQYVRDLYAAEVAYTDMHLGKLFAWLQDNGHWDDTLVIVTSDHGEEFGEHEQWGHGKNLYDTLLRVPLIVHYPGAFEGGERVDTPVRLEDIAPTIADVVGIDAPDSWMGTTLRDLDGPRDIYASVTRRVAGQEGEDWRDLPTARAVVADGQKWAWYPPRSDRNVLFEVFDLVADPGERTNLFDRSRSAAIKERIEALQRRYPPRAGGDNQATASQEQLEHLKALGYVK